MSAPEGIWAVTEPNDESADILGDVYAQQTPDGMVGKPVKYIRADLCTPTDERVAALVNALKDLLEAHESGWPDKQDWGAGDRARAALRDMDTTP